jgi:predicted nucleotidyltransferase component of viral defense system
LFCQEEFVRRLSYSIYKEILILKGGYLLYTISGFATRPTTDADYLLKDYPNDLNTIETLINDIISTPTDNDFISIEFLSLEKITEFKEYHGIRVKLIGKICSTKTPFSIDIGVGDLIVPGPIKRFLPALLDNFQESEILTYSLESIISEKLQVIVSMMELTSRMKDFYDIYYLACNFNFDGLKLQEAIKETFSKRATPIEKDSITDLSTLIYDVDFQKQWVNYCKNTLHKSFDLSDIINIIIIFTAPLCEATINEMEYQKMWFAEIRDYKKYSETAK